MSESNSFSPHRLRDTEARVARLADESAASASARRDTAADPRVDEAEALRAADDARAAERQAEVAAGERDVAGTLEVNAAALRESAAAIHDTEARLEQMASDVQSVVEGTERLRVDLRRIRQAVRQTPVRTDGGGPTREQLAAPPDEGTNAAPERG
ncbi:MAG TPA: hypothetical protein VNA89_16585 [Gemmatimonadaceae bacterium]|nr:hypothetical protein [Gemmatimonadaceae bacterium]